MSAFWGIAFSIIMVSIMVLFLIRTLKRMKKNENKNTAIIKEILGNGREATATILSVSMRNLPHEESYMRVIFRIKFQDTGDEYFLRREEFRVPMQYISDFRVNNELPVTVHRDNLQWVLFEFGRLNSDEISIYDMFEDPKRYSVLGPCVYFNENEQSNNTL